MTRARWSRRGLALGALPPGVALVVFVALPLPAELLDYRPVASVRILDRDGGLLRELLSGQDGRGVPIAASDVPPHVRAAFVAAEDRGFYSHHGVAPLSIARAFWQNLRAGRVVSGGSTLTQQLARSLVPRPRTLWGKVQEAAWALRLEAHLSKEEVLTQYLNRVPLGNGTSGIEAAAQLYFGRSARHLSLAQAAALAAVPRGPSAQNPYRHPERLDRRKAWILRRMAALELVAPEATEAAVRESLDVQAFSASFRAPHFVEYLVRNRERWGLGEATVIETSLDPRLQLDVEDQVRQEISRLGDRRVGSAAVLVIDNVTGEVLAYQGSADFFDERILGQNDGVQMRRQPGSALKPFVYAEAFSARFTPATVLPDVDSSYSSSRGAYSPHNYDRRAHGPVRAREALANSYNVPAVQVADALGPERVFEALRRAGFDSLDQGAQHYGLGMVLGNGEVPLWELARAYAGLSRGGVLRSLRPIRRALRADGTELPLPEELAPRRFAAEASVALVSSILSDASARARAFGLDNALRLPFPAAAKTGTSKGYSDNWTAGYTRERTVAVWAGNFDGEPMVQVSGITGAGPLFKRVMTRAMAGVDPRPLWREELLEAADICPLSGERAGPHCPASMRELFVKGKVPGESCRMHRHLAADLPRELLERCRALAGAGGAVVDLGPDFYDWARAEGRAQEPWLAAACAASTGGDGGGPAITFPLAGDEFLLFPDLPQADQGIPLRIRASPREGPLEVWMDGERLFALGPPFTGRLPARRGEHRLSLRRTGGVSSLADVRFTVRAEQGER